MYVTMFINKKEYFSYFNYNKTYENLYCSFMIGLLTFFLPLRPFFVLFVGVSLRDVLSVVDVLPTLEVSSLN